MTPESHLYVASYAPDAQSDQIVRLTALGYSHAVTFDTYGQLGRIRDGPRRSIERSPTDCALGWDALDPP